MTVMLNNQTQRHSINWVTSSEPLHQILDEGSGCPRRSAGTTIHEWTSAKALEPLWKFLFRSLKKRNGIIEDPLRVEEESTEGSESEEKSDKEENHAKEDLRGKKDLRKKILTKPSKDEESSSSEENKKPKKRRK